MDLKNELENELAVAILIEKRHKRQIDADSSRELIDKIKGALSIDISSPDDAVELADAAIAH
ncbi:MAG: hypothetical protein DMF62_16095 [Acidobacteria bacterium]|nr:MAG: hypothetical protein DMF62_16095 [Acidobacteriota bacterium]